MSLASRLLARLYRLPPRRNAVRVTRGLRIPTSDGVTLAAHHYAPVAPGAHPTILLRIPYGLRALATPARIYAERGFHVLAAACRGTGESGGTFDPLSNEREDGLATLRWLGRQDWFDGRLGLSGPSYLGYATWAIADALPKVAAISTKITSAEFQTVVFPNGAFHLGLAMSWVQVMEALRGGMALFGQRALLGQVERRTAAASMTLPLREADKALTGHEVDFWRRWIGKAEGNDAFWRELDHRHRLGPSTPPNHFMSGWFDFMIDQLLRDYRTLLAAGHRPYLTIGGGTHVKSGMGAENLHETMAWMRAHLMGEPDALREKPVRLWIGGTGEWHDFDAFPAPERHEVLYLAAGRVLSRNPAVVAEPDRYRYDPADPTPNLGGAIFAFTGAGPVDQSPIERRADVLTYTSEPLERDLLVIGNPVVRLFARSSLAHADFFVRLCDVSPAGASINVCDAIVRITDADAPRGRTLNLHATGHCFRAQHRLRLQVSSGAHPRYARNLGTGEPLATATRMQASNVDVFLGRERPSRLTLPVVEL